MERAYVYFNGTHLCYFTQLLLHDFQNTSSIHNLERSAIKVLRYKKDFLLKIRAGSHKNVATSRMLNGSII